MIGEKNGRLNKSSLKFSTSFFKEKEEINSRVEILMMKIFTQGIELRASDIHIEPYEGYFRLRYRVDGILIEKERYSYNEILPITSMIKILANLDITEKRLPQDGRVDGRYEDTDLDFRISVVPTYYGEKIVIRILYKDIAKKSLIELGFNKIDYEKLYELIKRKSGMLIISGPMGSGKTTTMYGILNEINAREKNILTIEDPVEYVIDGINQIQCKEDIGLDFIRVLKSILRQDVDILMIGEIRDAKTAEIAIKASLTGHLIITTLHTKNTVEAIKRLINLGIDPYMITSSLRGVLSQRLVRKLCPYCKIIEDNIDEKLKILDVSKNEIKKEIYTHKGCEKCNFTGYKGRILLGEFMYIDTNKEKFITDNLSSPKLIYEELGIKSLLDTGLSFVLEGVTSLDELIREC